ncbi:alkene reductase [Chitinimonas prasina]|uniref:Alkene reductase n=1 Tax=Chitinimonas prasina TaxID=1434937 RepID=A0ABQ5YFD9_9NEIS|nr:alkene reductase [Chitinimonas prasina]GLR13715.1 alkene reductase [Chitinimonas prasina]
MAIDKLLTPHIVGKTTLPNRVWMAPLTRSRAAQPGDLPAELNAIYYSQRANAGLTVTEATQISQQGQGYAWTPGIYTDEQEAGWAQVVNRVHAAGGHISLQLWHVGRISHHLLQADGQAPVAPSAIQAQGAKSFVVLPDGTPSNEPTDLPRALELAELPGIVAAYVAGARRAVRAGFDFVEIHSANGYLLNQFLDARANQRTDQYGGSIENRARFVLEVVDAIVAAIGAEKVGIRLSPNGVFGDMSPIEGEAMAIYLAQQLQQRHLAYLHIAEPDWAGGEALTDTFRQQLRAAFKGTLVFCGSYTAERAEALIQAGTADAVAFGRPYIANPDLVRRFTLGAELNQLDPATLYGGAEQGYTDYPALAG